MTRTNEKMDSPNHRIVPLQNLRIQYNIVFLWVTHSERVVLTYENTKGGVWKEFWVLVIFVDKIFICKLDYRLIIKFIKLSWKNSWVLDSRILGISFITIMHLVELIHFLTHSTTLTITFCAKNYVSWLINQGYQSIKVFVRLSFNQLRSSPSWVIYVFTQLIKLQLSIFGSNFLMHLDWSRNRN